MKTGYAQVSGHLLINTAGPDTTETVIGDITIIGNKTTKDHIVLRELAFPKRRHPFKYDFDAKRIRSEENLYNTSLFNIANLTYLKTPKVTTSVFVIVKERWYVFPLPVFEVVDRNFNVWWRTKDFSRIVYGGVLSWNNFRGRNETVALAIRLGYIQQINFSYSIPYINKNQHSGLSLGFSYSRNHQTSYQTIKDDITYYNIF